MRRNRARGLIHARGAEEVAPPLRAELESHLADCPDCRRYHVEFDKLLAVLHSLPPPPSVPEAFTDRVMVRARQWLETPQSAPRRRHRLRDWWDWVCAPQSVGAMGAVSAGLLLGVFLGQQAWHGSANTGKAEPEAASVDLLRGYSLDLLSGSPHGSFTDAYMSLTSRSGGWET